MGSIAFRPLKIGHCGIPITRQRLDNISALLPVLIAGSKITLFSNIHIHLSFQLSIILRLPENSKLEEKVLHSKLVDGSPLKVRFNERTLSATHSFVIRQVQITVQQSGGSKMTNLGPSPPIYHGFWHYNAPNQIAPQFVLQQRNVEPNMGFALKNMKWTPRLEDCSFRYSNIRFLHGKTSTEQMP